MHSPTPMYIYRKREREENEYIQLGIDHPYQYKSAQVAGQPNALSYSFHWQLDHRLQGKRFGEVLSGAW